MSNPIKMNFIREFGDLADPYDCLTEAGNPSMKVNLYLFFFVICLIVAIIFLILSSPKKAKELGVDGKPKKHPRTKTQKTFLIISIIVFSLAVINIGVYGYLYFACFLNQFNKWYRVLSDTPGGITSYNEMIYNQQLLDKIADLESGKNNRISRFNVRLF